MSDCAHETFEAAVDVTRLEDLTPIGFAVDLRVVCTGCREPLRFLCPDVGVLPDRPALSADGHPDNKPPWSEVLPWLQDLAGLWRESTTETRRRIAEQLFARVDALGCRELVVTPTAAAIAHGLVAGVQRVTVVGATGFGPVTVRFRTPPRLIVAAERSA